jgi:2-hydroxy-3-keto-5-methylthiopentenyl-1-phosphate phosphatase
MTRGTTFESIRFGKKANRSCSGFGHDKSLTIRPYANLPSDQRPTLFYAGDGVSDLSAARETDLLFAKKGHGTSRISQLGATKIDFE